MLHLSIASPFHRYSCPLLLFHRKARFFHEDSEVISQYGVSINMFGKKRDLKAMENAVLNETLHFRDLFVHLNTLAFYLQTDRIIFFGRRLFPFRNLFNHIFLVFFHVVVNARINHIREELIHEMIN